MWRSLGFRESPYNIQPLKPTQDDVDLLVGREKESNELITNFDSANEGIQVLSGSPGVGKTSFFNIQQFRLENGLTPFGPKLLAARKLCPVQPSDDNLKIAIRALESLYKSVEQWCLLNNKVIPIETKKLGKWIGGAGSDGFDVGIEILGFGGNFGRTVELPKMADTSFEGIVDAITAVTAEVVDKLGFDCVAISLDNLENLSDAQLGSMLISFRDTLFSIPCIWWVLIGQSGLGSLIQTLDPRVFERISGSGIEIRPVAFDELDEAIALRVKKFHTSGDGKAPLLTEMHKLLYDASFGEMRFVFKYSNSICAKFVENVRLSVLNSDDIKALINTSGSKERITKSVTESIGSSLINSQMSYASAYVYLHKIVSSELDGLFLKPKEKHVLSTIGKNGKASPSDYKDFGFKTMQDFSSNYLTKLFHQKLLVREQEGRSVNYRLRGIANLSFSFHLLG